MRAPKTVLLISQVYLPDPAAVGMQVADAAAELVARGFRVQVLTADRGYDDPSQKYPRREVLEGVEVRRVPFSSLGKSSMVKRLISGLLFVLQASVLGSCLRRVDAVIVSTAPPMCALAALIVSLLRRAPLAYWVMDLNPDQMVVLGRLKQTSIVVRAFDVLNRAVLGRAQLVVALDEFMAKRLLGKLDGQGRREVHGKLEVLPPWPHDNHLTPIAHEDNPFRQQHQLEGKFVVMYSGNHGPSSPVTTCLSAAAALETETNIAFLFVGGGVGKAEVDQAISAGATNLRSLPYEPLDRIKYSLSAADLHLVTVGDAIVGVVHPSKIYGAMSLGRPILLTAPAECHATPLVGPAGTGIHVQNGDVEGATAAILRIVQMSATERQEMGARARDLIAAHYSREILRKRFVDLVCLKLGLSSD